jgi:hypothetical protein
LVNRIIFILGRTKLSSTIDRNVILVILLVHARSYNQVDHNYCVFVYHIIAPLFNVRIVA